MKKVLIVGGSGLLGSKLIADLKDDYDLTATYFKHTLNKHHKISSQRLNIVKYLEVKKIISLSDWDYVLHTSSIGDVDYCEKHKKIAWQVNVVGTRNIVKACKKYNIPLIFFSTNAVYSGESGLYNERMHPKAINYYGKTKLIAESIVKKYRKSLILRLNTMYGWSPKNQRLNPAMWIINNLKKNKSIKVVSDIYNNHLWVGFVSIVIKKILKKWPKERVFNIGGKDCVSRYDFALVVAQVFNLNSSLIFKSTSEEFPSIAPRPKNTCFDITKMESVFGIKSFSIKKGLETMKRESLKHV